MALWQRLLITLIAMLIVSFVAGLASSHWFAIALPSYAAGVVGGMTTLPVWELLKRINIREGTK